MKRAFTLIELLVVIAIIAILAAILFPVFAQAKEAAKKTRTLSQFKQIGTAAHIYIADADDQFPLSFSFNSAANSWRAGFYHAVPQGSVTSGDRHLEPRKSEEGVFVLNAIQPYTKNYDLYKADGLRETTVANTFVPGIKAASVNLTFNGMLHAYSATAINQPSKLPLFWQGNYKENLLAFTSSNPVLNCDGTGPACRFNPGGKPQANSSEANYGYWWFGSATPAAFTTFVYGRGMAFVASDSSARFINFGNLPKWPQYASMNVNHTPWSAAAPQGSGYPDGAPWWMTDCVAPGATKNANSVFYPGFFRPDSEFSYTEAQCDHGGG